MPELFLEEGIREVKVGIREAGDEEGEDFSKASLEAVGEVFRGSLEYMVNDMGD